MRALSTLWVFTLMGCATAGGGNAPAVARPLEAPPLSSFDYVVLASLADADRPISLASYSPNSSHD